MNLEKQKVLSVHIKEDGQDVVKCELETSESKGTLHLLLKLVTEKYLENKLNKIL